MRGNFSNKVFLFCWCLIGSTLCCSSGALGATAESTGSTGSITVTKHANAAAKAFAAHNYATAKQEYRIAIALSPDTTEFYYGLYDVGIHSGEWDQVVFALEKIFELDPSKKQPLLAQYGEALFRLGHYDEALPVLKKALKEADLPSQKIALVAPPPIPEPESTKESTPDGPSGAASTTPDQSVRSSSGNLAGIGPVPEHKTFLAKDSSQFKLTFQNAAHSECILLAEYIDYERSPAIQYFHPPTANYHITKILKGPPLNSNLPIRYEFYDRSNNTMPEGWKFGPDKMPKKGSEWIIFLRIALPRDGAFDTYEGSYGRQPATEENLNTIYSLLENSANR